MVTQESNDASKRNLKKYNSQNGFLPLEERKEDLTIS